MRTFGAALAVGVLVATSACSGGSRPSQGDVSSALQKGGDNSVLGGSGAKVSKKAADCIAKVLVESKISDRALKAIIDGKKDYKASKQDQTAAVAVSSKIVQCLPAGLDN